MVGTTIRQEQRSSNFGRALLVMALLAASILIVPGAAAGAGNGQGNNNQGTNKPTNIEPGCYSPDIGTVETARSIDSHVAEVCFETPQLVNREHMTFYTVDLTITGVDSSPYGGDCGIFDVGCGYRQASYDSAPVTLWFPRNWGSGNDATLVQYQHPASSLAGEDMVGLGAIQQGMAYVAHGGEFEGAFGTIVDGPFAGFPVPLSSTAVIRDVASVASDWLERHAGSAPDLKYITGFSAGGWMVQAMMAGNLFGVPHGNNHLDPDDLGSAPFYDAALYMGAGGGPIFGPDHGTPGATATAVPSIYIQGEQDGTSIWRDVANWIDFVGDDAAPDMIAIWSVRGQGHLPNEWSTSEDPNLGDLFLADRHGPVVTAALKSLHRAVTKGHGLTSYLGGEIVTRQPGDPAGGDCLVGSGGPDTDRLVRWTTLDGVPTYTSIVPVSADDVAVYSSPFDELFDKQPCEREIDALERIQDVLAPEPAIVPPLAAHRIGPVFMDGTVNVLIPGAQIDVCAEYGNLNAYVGQLHGTAGQLRGQGVWTPVKGSTGDRLTDVFAYDPMFVGIVGTFEAQGCA